MVSGGNARFSKKLTAFFIGYKMITYKMQTSYYIQEGQIVRKNDGKNHDSDGLFSLSKWLKKALTSLNVAFTDDCCDADANSVPLRYDPATSKIQRYNPANDTWVDLSSF
jgi:hypothetical protein